ncbi:MAG: PH domain-containing protein [Bacteroidetes bacterium]|nr:PH domain-containing protein [Bacteroidota bacterium]
MVTRFESKKDWTFPIIWGFVLVIYSIIGCLILYSGGRISDLFVLGAVWLALGLLLYLLIKTTYYTVNDVYLTCHILGFRKNISIENITKIEQQKGLYAGLKINTAWKGLVVSYGKWDEILISPADEAGFIAALKAKNPSLKV